MLYEKKINFFKDKIDKEIIKFFKQKTKDCKFLNPTVSSLISEMENFTVRGGKRLRSILMILGFHGYNKKNIDFKNIIKLSIVWEIIQSFLLIHDDIIDRDELRRGGDTLHVALSKKYKNPHLGSSEAILCGDLLYMWSIDHIIKFAGSYSNRLIELINSETANVVIGEMIDVDPWSISDDYISRINLIHDLKTVRYTTLGPFLSGAILCDIDKSEIELIKKFTTHLGLAFQIKDDYLGIFGNTKITGKSILSDVKDGKLTHLIANLLKNGSKAEKEFTLNCLGNEKLTLNMFNKLKNIIVKTESDINTVKLIKMHSSKSLKYLEKLNINHEIKLLLNHLIYSLVIRDY